MESIEVGPFEFHDKIPLESGIRKGVRVVPHAISRYGSFIEKGAVLMPSCKYRRLCRFWNYG